LALAVTGRERRQCDVSAMSLLHTFVSFQAIIRILLGATPFVAARSASRLLGFPSAHDTATTRLMARFFGVRDIGLGVLALWALRHPEALPFIALFNAAMDAGDLFSIAIPLVRRQGIDRAAVLSAMFAATGALSWLVVWLFAR
jgi:hypothetical protein